MSAQHTVVLVCAANICRSPLMELVLRDCLPAAEWRILSVGTNVSTGTHSAASSTMCSISAQIAGVDGTAHTPTPMTPEDLERSDLIVTASRAERAAVATMDPSTRGRAFTLHEAIHLGERSPDPEEWEAAQSAGADTSHLQRYAAILHHRRGLLAPPPPPRKLLPWRSPTDPLDVPDVHGSKPAIHRAVLREVADQTRTLGSRIGDDPARKSPGGRGATRTRRAPIEDSQEPRR